MRRQPMVFPDAVYGAHGDHSDDEEGPLDPTEFIQDYLALANSSGDPRIIATAKRQSETIARHHQQRTIRRRVADREDDVNRGQMPSREELQQREEQYRRGIFRQQLPLSSTCLPVFPPPQDHQWEAPEQADAQSWGEWSHWREDPYHHDQDLREREYHDRQLPYDETELPRELRHRERWLPSPELPPRRELRPGGQWHDRGDPEHYRGGARPEDLPPRPRSVPTLPDRELPVVSRAHGKTLCPGLGAPVPRDGGEPGRVHSVV